MPVLPLLAAALVAAGQAGAPPAAAPPAEPELAGASLGAVRTPSSPDAWGGPRTGAEPTLSNRVADYALRAVLDPVKHTLDGTARLTWRNRSDVPVRSLYFHLYLNAFEGEGSTFMTEKARYGAFRSGVEIEKGEWGSIELRSVRQNGKEAGQAFVHPDGGPETDHTVVRVDLPEAVPPGGTTTLELKFFDQLPRVMARTGWFDRFHLAGQWYPKIGVLELPGERGATRPRWNCHEFHLHSEFYADFGAYDLEVVVPEGYRVGASGVRQGAPVPGKDGVTHRFRAEDVHDVAFTAWDGFAAPLEGTWTGPGSPEVKVEVLYPPEFERSARETLDATVAALEFYSRTLGPYPYPHVTVVIPPHNAGEAGGMEYETFFTNIGSNEFPLDGEGIAGYVAVHEFGHGYFMGLLASNEFEEPFLDEGLNEWWNSRMLGGKPARFRMPLLLRALGFDGFSIDIWDFERLTAADRFPADPIAGNSWHRYSAASYNAVYPRTAVAFRDLGVLIGEPHVDAAMKLYYARWHHRHPSTADLEQAFLDAAPGEPERKAVRDFFETQVYAATAVDDRVVSIETKEVLPLVGTSAAADGTRTELTEEDRDKQVSEARKSWKKEHGEPDRKKPGPYPWRSTIRVRRHEAHVPRLVVLTLEDGTVETIPWPVGETWRRIEVVRELKVKEAALGPARGYLLDLDRTDDARQREPARGRTARVALGAEGFLRVLLSLVEAL